MALGDSYNNTDNNAKKYYSPEIYSPYGVSNENGVDPSALSYSYWNGALKISIAPMLKNPTSSQKWDRKNAATIFLTHRAARILRAEAQKVLKGEIHSGGTKSGAEGLITFSDGSEVGAAGYCLIIRKINPDNGDINGTYVYEFRTGFHYGIQNFQADSSNFKKDFFDTIEVDEFLDILEQYYLAASKMYAGAVIDEMKYDNSRMNTKIGLIAEALGVEFKGGNGNHKSGGQSYFDRNNGDNSSSSSNSSYSSSRGNVRETTLEDLAGTNPDEDD